MSYCSICGSWYQEGMHSIEVCATQNMSKNAPGNVSYVDADSIQKTGEEAGATFFDMGAAITKRYPKISMLVGTMATMAFVFYGLTNWEFHPLIFGLMTVAFYFFSVYFLITTLIIVAVFGSIGFVIIYLISLL